MYFCHFGDAFGEVGKVVLFIPVGAILMFYAMYILQTTADEYLGPSLAFMTNYFQIPQSLAGVTLLAFGNGAPDFFASLAAAGNNTEQV